MPPQDGQWARIGEMLVQRRIEIDPRYRNRRLFAVERGLNWRLLHDVERAKRVNFEPETLAAIEVAYSLVRGSFARTLAGAELEPQDAAPPPEAAPGPHRFPDLYAPDLEPYLQGVRDDLADAVRRYGPEHTGEQAFPHDDLAADAWEFPGLRPDERVRHIADLRRRRDLRRSRRQSGEETALCRT